MLYKWIIFDADGTLFDYNAAEFYALKNSFTSFDLAFTPGFIDSYRHFNKILWDQFERGEISIPRLKIKRFDLLLNKLEMKISPQDFSSTYLDHLSQRHDLIDGTIKILQDLAESFSLVLMTNGIKEVQRSRLELSPIKEFFSDIIISDEVGCAKPDKRIFEISHQRMSSPIKTSILMVGDNLTSDIQGGIDFGIDTCWYNPESFDPNPHIKPTYEIRNLDELREIVY